MSTHPRPKSKRQPATRRNAPTAQAQEERESSAHDFQAFFDLIPDLACIASTNGYFTKVNPAWEKLLGYTKKELLATPFINLIHPDDRKSTLAEVSRQMSGGLTDGFVNRYRGKDGQYRWLEWRSSQSIEKNLLYATARNITEQKQLAGRQALAFEVLRLLNEPASLCDAIASILSTIQKETGFDAVGIRLQQGADFPYYVHHGFTDDFLAAENNLAKYQENGDVCRNPDGSVRLECTCGLVLSGQIDPNHPLFTPRGSFWSNNTLPLLDLPPDQDPRLHPRNRCIHVGFCSVALIPVRADNKIVGLLQLNDRRTNCFTRDMINFFEGLSDSIGIALTRKQEDDALRESEERFRTLMESIPLPVFFKNAEGRYTGINQAFEKLYGKSRDQLIGKSVFDVAPRELATLYHAKDLELMQTPGVQIYETRMQDARKQIHDVIFHKASFTNSEGNVIGLIGAIIDITERRQKEAEVQRLQNNLYHMDRVMRMGEMAASLAHELNQPLTGILLNAQVSQQLLTADLPDLTELRAIQGDIVRDAKRAGQVIRRLRAFLKRDTSAWESTAINNLVPEILRFIRSDTALREVTIETNLAAELPNILGDRIQLQEVLLNLISNATHAMAEQPPATRHIAITTAQATDHAGVLVTVRDHGTGFRPEDLPKVFDPYFTTKTDGLGMGLRICLSIIEAHGGKIWAENHPAGGAVLSFTLPAEK